VVRVQQLPVADERIQLRIVRRERDGGGVEHAAQHVVAAVTGVRAAERIWVVGIGRRAQPPQTIVLARGLSAAITAGRGLPCER